MIEMGAGRKLVFLNGVSDCLVLIEVYFVIIGIYIELKRYLRFFYIAWSLRIKKSTLHHLRIASRYIRHQTLSLLGFKQSLYRLIKSHISNLHGQLISEFTPQHVVLLFLPQSLNNIYLVILVLQKQLHESCQLILW